MSDATPLSQNGVSLQTFQNKLAQRIAQAQSNPQQTNTLLCAVLNDQLLLLPLLDIAEIRSPLPITVINHAQDWVLGLSVAKADVLTIIDLSAFLFKPTPSATSLNKAPSHFSGGAALGIDSLGVSAKTQKLIVLSADVSYQVGFLVDHVIGTTTLEEGGYRQTDFASALNQTALLGNAPLLAAWRRADGHIAFEVSLRDLLKFESTAI